jgi:2-aminoadipate transaminase
MTPKNMVLPFDFSALITAKNAVPAQRWTGYPPFHFVGGNINENTIPSNALAAAAARVMRPDWNSLAKYGMDSGPLGYLPLREFVVRNLRQKADIEVTLDEVLLTTGSLQAMDIVNSLLLEAGDLVLLEAANYAGTLSRLDRIGVEYIGIDLDDGGMRIDHLREVLGRLRHEGCEVKYIYTIPTLQNPTGTIMSHERRLQLLEVAREFDVPIFEDDCYADLIWEGERPPSIYSLDNDGRVLYCGTFSKTVAPALRVGYLVAPWNVMQYLLPLKTDAGSGALAQMILAEYLPENFDQHVASLLPTLREKSDAMVSALIEHFGSDAQFTRPTGGIYVWVTLPESVDTVRLAIAAGAEGIAINAGPEWTVDGDANRHRMRLCFGHPEVSAIREGVAKLAKVCRREFGVPAL